MLNYLWHWVVTLWVNQRTKMGRVSWVWQQNIRRQGETWEHTGVMHPEKVWIWNHIHSSEWTWKMKELSFIPSEFVKILVKIVILPHTTERCNQQMLESRNEKGILFRAITFWHKRMFATWLKVYGLTTDKFTQRVIWVELQVWSTEGKVEHGRLKIITSWSFSWWNCFHKRKNLEVWQRNKEHDNFQVLLDVPYANIQLTVSLQ